MKLSELMIRLSNRGFTLLDSLSDAAPVEKQLLELRRRTVFKTYFGNEPEYMGMTNWQWHLTVAQDMFKNEELNSEIDYILQDVYLEGPVEPQTGFLGKSI